MNSTTGVDRAAFTQMIDDNYGLLIRIATSKIPDMSSAEDVVAETCAAAWERWRAGESVGVGWLRTVLSRRICDHYRSRPPARLHTEQATEGADVEVDTRTDVQRAISGLTHREAEVIYLTYWCQAKAAEIAHRHGTTTEATWAVLSRARRRLRVLLEV